MFAVRKNILGWGLSQSCSVYPDASATEMVGSSLTEGGGRSYYEAVETIPITSPPRSPIL